MPLSLNAGVDVRLLCVYASVSVFAFGKQELFMAVFAVRSKSMDSHCVIGFKAHVPAMSQFSCSGFIASTIIKIRPNLSFSLKHVLYILSSSKYVQTSSG